MIIPVIQLLHLIYLWVLKFVPNPEFFIYPYLASSGWLPYRQIIDQHFPGLLLLPLNFATFGFNDPASFKILLLLVVLAQSVILYKIARKLFPGSSVAVFAVFFYAVWQPFFGGSELWIDLFLPLFTLPAFYFTMRKKWMITGLFLGLGLLFKQNLVLLLLIPVYYIFREPAKWSHLLDYLFGLCVPWIPVLFYFQIYHLLPDFLYWTVIFNLTVYPAQSGLLPKLPDLLKISAPLILGMISLISLRKSQKYIYPVFIWGFLSVITSFSRYGLNHFQPAVPFFCLGLGLLAASLSRYQKLLLVLVSVLWSLGLTFRHQPWLQTAYFTTADSGLVTEINTLTRPGDIIFALGGQPLIYQQTRTFPPNRHFSYPLPWYFSVDQYNTVLSLLAEPPKLVIYNPESSVDGKNISSYAPVLIKYIQDNYHQVNKVGPNVIYLPKQ